MLSIQQLIKALRNLQNTGGDLVKSLKNHVAAAPTTKTTTVPAIVSVSSLLSEHDEVSSSQQQKNQKTNINSSQQTTPAVECRTSHTANASLYPHLNESGCSTAINVHTTTQDLSNNTTSHLTQQIQNFHQQQFHYFHTQHNQSLFAKQKQTQFAMSSLAMTESLALKQDDTVTKDGGGDAPDAKDDGEQQSSSSGRPCFNTGLPEILQFMELIGNLKHTKRTGWVLRDVNDCESISGHMYRMSMMTFLLDGSEGLNQIRCMELALVHDLAESLVGDITPFCGVSREDKRAMEFKAMDDICKLIEPRGKRIMKLFEEYEDGQSAESKFVKDLDRLDMVMQAFEYEKRDDCLLKHQEFFDSTEGKFNHPFVKKLVNEIYEQRKVLAKAKGATPPPTVHVPDTSAAPTTNGHCTAAKASSSSSSS